MRALAAAIAASALTTSCTSDALPDAALARQQSDASSAPQEDTSADTSASNLPQSGEPASGSNPDSDHRPSGTKPPDDPNADTPATPTQQGPAAPSCADDRASDGDSAGQTPGYSDIRVACVRDAGSSLLLELTMGGTVPARMPDRDTTMTVGFELQHGSSSLTYVYAEADHRGWTAYFSRVNGKHSTAESVRVDGDTIELTIARSQLGGARHLRWNAESSWLSADLLTTSYAFDSAPDRGHMTFGET